MWSFYDTSGRPLVATAKPTQTMNVMTANTTYFTPAGVRYLIVEGVGAGAAGGGAQGSAANVAVGSGGGAGSYGLLRITTPNTSYAVVCGIAGAGVAAANGGAGTNTTFGATTLICQGGSGGIANVNAITIQYQIGGAGGPAGSGGDINTPGEPGGIGFRFAVNTSWISGRGGLSPFGPGGQERVTAAAGLVGSGFGSGGSGAASNTTASVAGGNGTGGMIIVHEFY